MLSLSDTSISEVSSRILNAGYDVAFLVPTPTGLDKSILDAHQSIRSLFKRKGVHDYTLQRKGTNNKIIIEAKFITSYEEFEVKVSLYRPESKDGDPRIWIYGLKQVVRAGNLLALIVINNQLYIVNCSKPSDLDNAIQTALPKVRITLSPVADELLQKLIAISHKGFISTVTRGDTGVGMTLEAELGISANSSKSPDYKGIELKSTRVDARIRQKNRSQLFSKVPNWKLSPIQKPIYLINKRGYIDRDGFSALRHTISGDKVNSLGLYFDIDYANNYLRQMYKDTSDLNLIEEHDTTWLINDLKNALLKKHKETFWVKAKHNNDRTSEKFHYVEVEHTANPFIEKLETLIETGLITMDYTMHIKQNGMVRDHGYLFKLHQNSKLALFPETKKYDLTSY